MPPQQQNVRFVSDQGREGMGTSPGGFEFGVQGWTWGEPRPTGITFFLDDTAMVVDQHGRPIRGVMDIKTNKELLFAMKPPEASRQGDITPRPQYGTHAQVIKALEAERIDWRYLNWCGWPQIPIDQLKDMEPFPTPKEELIKIKDKAKRREALKLRRIWDQALERDLAAEEAELAAEVDGGEVAELAARAEGKT